MDAGPDYFVLLTAPPNLPDPFADAAGHAAFLRERLRLLLRRDLACADDNNVWEVLELRHRGTGVVLAPAEPACDPDALDGGASEVWTARAEADPAAAWRAAMRRALVRSVGGIGILERAGGGEFLRLLPDAAGTLERLAEDEIVRRVHLEVPERVAAEMAEVAAAAKAAAAGDWTKPVGCPTWRCALLLERYGMFHSAATGGFSRYPGRASAHNCFDLRDRRVDDGDPDGPSSGSDVLASLRMHDVHL